MNRLTMWKLFYSLVILTTVLSSSLALPWENTLIVKVDGDETEARRIAEAGFCEYLGPLPGFDQRYVMRQKQKKSNRREPTTEIFDLLGKDSHLLSVQPQKLLKLSHRNSLSGVKGSRKSRSLETRAPGEPVPPKISYKQWYLLEETLPSNGHQITTAWKRGFTGKGVVVGVVDDGVDHHHNDLKKNYDKKASHDYAYHDDDPSPSYNFNDTSRHGTNCAGLIAMNADVQKCGVGVAYDAKLGGLRFSESDAEGSIQTLEGAPGSAIRHQTDYIDIYSNSWGPDDDGMNLEEPPELFLEALHKGVKNGRKGKGSIFVFAAGNGGLEDDNCNCDGYVSSIYTIAISGVTQQNTKPYFTEKCSSILAVAYTAEESEQTARDISIAPSCPLEEKFMMATTDLHNGCTDQFGGTSASAPIAAGIFALVLSANDKVKWRDMQHLVVCTSKHEQLSGLGGWTMNKAGFHFHLAFGFGILSANDMINVVKDENFQSASEMFTCDYLPEQVLPLHLADNNRIHFSVGHCSVKYVEHVQVQIEFFTKIRGKFEMTLTSPLRTTSILMTPRRKDRSTLGYRNFNLTSVHFWGENPKGNWVFEIKSTDNDFSASSLGRAQLFIYGADEDVNCLKKKE